MEEKDSWGISEEEIKERLRNLNQEKREKGLTRGGRSSGQGVKLLFIRDYLYQYATKEHPKNAKAIQEYLSKHQIKADVKTIYNDILRLQTDFSVPIEYNAKKWGYYITTPIFAPYELRLMVDSIQSSKFITQKEANTITQKITGLADVYTKESLNRVAYVSDRVRSRNDKVVKDADRIHNAITQNRKISFRYFHYTPNKDNPKRYSKSGDVYVVSPYALLWDNGNYYLYAYTDKGKFRNFRIDRMENISHPLLAERDGEKEFKTSQITSREYKVFQMYHGTQMKVRVRFNNHFTDAVLDQFGKNVLLIPDGDKHFITTLPVEVSPPFWAWISMFGKGAKVLHPEEAVNRMKAFINNLTEMYTDEGEK